MRQLGSPVWQREWTLLARDPWSMSQTLMQILYLLPPAFGSCVGLLSDLTSAIAAREPQFKFDVARHAAFLIADLA